MRIPGLGRAKRVTVPAPRRPMVAGRWFQIVHGLTADTHMRVWTAWGRELIPPTVAKGTTTDVLLPLGHVFIIRVRGTGPDGEPGEYTENVQT